MLKAFWEDHRSSMTQVMSRSRAIKSSPTMLFYSLSFKLLSLDTWWQPTVLWEPSLVGWFTFGEMDYFSSPSPKSLTSLALLSIGDQQLAKWRAGPQAKSSTQWTSPKTRAWLSTFRSDLTSRSSTTCSRESVTTTTRLSHQKSKKFARITMSSTGQSLLWPDH